MNIAVNRNLSNCENSPKKRFFGLHLYSRSSKSFHSVFHSFHGLMNSINWPASSVWVFIAQLGEHCSANAEATGSNPVEAPKIFFSGYFRNCLNCDSLRCSHTHFTIHCVAEDFLSGYYVKIDRRRIKEYWKHNDRAKISSTTQRIAAEIPT